MLDSRGVVYATHVAEHFADQSPEMLFGLVRHVIRTEFPDDPETAELEAARQVFAYRRPGWS